MAPSRIEISNSQSDLGCWRAAQRPAETRLRAYVLRYFASEGLLPSPLHERHLPSREVTIVLNFASPHKILARPEAEHPTEHRKAWIVALQNGHQIREAFGVRDFMVIRLTPIGAHMLLRMPLDLFTNRIVPLEDVDAGFCRLLTENAAAVREWASRFDIVENIIAERLASAPAPPRGLLYLWRILHESPNDIELAELPDSFGCSRRHLIAQFRKYFGMPPKMIVRLSRFNLALAMVHRLRADPLTYAEGKPYLDHHQEEVVDAAPAITTPWPDVALDCGYYDQSHLINEFKSFSGLSPLQFLRRTRE